MLRGLHHITLVTSNSVVNRKFYSDVLGLRLVKLTVNQDDVFHRHLFYGDEQGSTGSVITFFEWPHLPRGVVGLGSPHHLAYSVKKPDAIPLWVSWLKKNGIHVVGPYVRGDRVAIYFRDPDGALIEITAKREDITGDYLDELISIEREVDGINSDMKLSFLDHASPISSDHELTARFFEKFLNVKPLYKARNPDDGESFLLGIGGEEDYLIYLVSSSAIDGWVGVGNIHHIAFCVDGEEEQRMIMRRLNMARIPNSGIIDRFWFKSLYFRDPDGNLLEIATRGPGYTRDEPLEELGKRLILPPWLERSRAVIEARLAELDRKNPLRWPPSYDKPPEKPESLHSLAIAPP